MTRKALLIALCSALPVTAVDGQDNVPEWIHLLPAGSVARTMDGRGPYKITSLQAIADQLKPGEKLPIDECHATDRAAPMGLPAPARGWIVALEAREDGLWGRVEWTATGVQLMAEKAYNGISPAILHTKDNTVLRVLRASLINTPNLQGLVALNSEETSMDWKTWLIEALGLDSNADDAAVQAALKAKLQGGASGVDLCSQVMQHPTFVALQGEAAATAKELGELREERARDRAVAFVDAAIGAGHVGVKPARDEYIALHMAGAERAEKLISALPKVEGNMADLGKTAPGAVAAAGDLTEVDHQIIGLMGLDEETYKAGLASRGQRQETL